MRGARYDRILAGTALTLVLTFASAHAQPDLLEAKMPLPEQSVVPPPTAADLTGTTSNSSVPKPITCNASTTADRPPARRHSAAVRACLRRASERIKPHPAPRRFLAPVTRR